MAPHERLFIAIWPPETVVEQLTAFQRPEVPGLRWTTPDQWHVTVRFFGSVSPADQVVDAWHRIDIESMPTKVEASMGPGTGRLGRRILQVPVHGLEGVAGSIIDATADIGKAPDRRPFAGHLTLARCRDRGGVDLRPLTGLPLATRWPVTELTLVASHLGAGPGGRARYDVVARLPLG